MCRDETLNRISSRPGCRLFCRYYRLSLEVWTRTAAPLDWAWSQYALSCVYVKRVVGDRADNIECALACCRRALEVRSHSTAPLEWAQGQQLLRVM